MFEVASSLSLPGGDRMLGEYDHGTNGEIANGFHPRRRSEKRLLVIHAGAVPEEKLGEQLLGLGYEPGYLPSKLVSLEEFDERAAGCEAIILDWRRDAPEDGRFADALAGKAADIGLPVLTLAAKDRAADIQCATEAGFAVLSTPCRLADLKSSLEDMLRPEPAGSGLDDFGLSHASALLESCKFRFRTPEDIDRLVPVVAALFPEPQRSAAGLAELMMNAVEHGNLEIGHERKADWVARGVYQSELLKRLQTPPFSSRWAELIVTRRADGLMIVIMDEGCGFCWQNLIGSEARHPGALVEPCGHGLAIAQRESFDDLRFNHIGNQVTAFVETNGASDR